MSAKVYNLDGEKKGDPVLEVVELLEEWLEMARRGEVHAIGIVGVCEGAELLVARVENDRWAALLAAHEMAKHSMLMEAHEA